MCGIFGHIPIKGAKANELAFKILGMENESRGTDSCGYYYGGVVKKGVDANKVFSKFMENHILQKGDLYPNLIGHARSSSPGIKGGNTEYNSHPFEVDDLVLTHNGVIYNIDQLAEKYEVDVTDINVDSHKLAKIISEKGLDALHNYVGYAALAFVFKNEPETVYLYHGASKSYSAGKVEEERPLFIMETNEGVYYSSLINALLRIRKSDDEEPYMLPHNNVFKIVEGVIQDEIYVVNREENNIDQYKYKNYNNNSSSAYGGYGTQGDFFRGTGRSGMVNSPTANRSTFSSNATYGFNNRVVENIVLKETIPHRAHIKTNIVFYWKGRHWIKKDKLEEIELANGCFILDKKGIISSEVSSGTSKYYFVSGIMIKNEQTYKQYLSDLEKGINIGTIKADPSIANFAYWMSRYSRYPISNLENEARSTIAEQRFRWFINETFERVSKEPISPKFSSRNYHFDEGSFLKTITTSDKNEKEVFINILPERVESKVDELDAFSSKIRLIKSMFSIPFLNAKVILNNRFATNCLKEIIEFVYKECWHYELSATDTDYYIEFVLDECVKNKTSVLQHFNELEETDLNNILRRYFEQNEELLNEDEEEKKTVTIVSSNIIDLNDEDEEEDIIEDVEDITILKDKIPTMDEVDRFEYTTMLSKKIEDINGISNNLQRIGEVLVSLDFKEDDDLLQDLAQLIFRQRENLISDINSVLDKHRVKHTIKNLKD